MSEKYYILTETGRGWLRLHEGAKKEYHVAEVLCAIDSITMLHAAKRRDSPATKTALQEWFQLMLSIAFLSPTVLSVFTICQEQLDTLLAECLKNNFVIVLPTT